MKFNHFPASRFQSIFGCHRIRESLSITSFETPTAANTAMHIVPTAVALSSTKQSAYMAVTPASAANFAAISSFQVNDICHAQIMNSAR
jgi:hypothetical protein